MHPNKQLHSEDINRLVRRASESKYLFKFVGQFYTPEEFKKLTEKKGVMFTDFQTIDPREVITKGKLKLYEFLSKQMLFEKKVEDYLTGKIT